MDRKITDYKIIRISDIDILSEVVMEHINSGWELYGSPFYAYNQYCQGVVLYS
jgi:hypothetical protein